MGHERSHYWSGELLSWSSPWGSVRRSGIEVTFQGLISNGERKCKRCDTEWVSHLSLAWNVNQKSVSESHAGSRLSLLFNDDHFFPEMIRFHPEHDEMLSNQTQQNLTFFGHVQYFPGFDFAVIQLNLAGGIPEVLKSLVNIPQRDGISKDIRDEIRKKLHAYNEIAANATETLDAMDSAGKTEHADDSGKRNHRERSLTVVSHIAFCVSPLLVVWHGK